MSEKNQTVVTITHKRGLHLSPSSIFAEKAGKFTADIQVALKEAPEDLWNGKRVIDLMSIGAVCGAELIITAEGDDANEALEALKTLVKEDFGLSI